MVIIKTKFCPLCKHRLRRIYTKDYIKYNGKSKPFWYELGWYCSECSYTLIDRFKKDLGYGEHLINIYRIRDYEKDTDEQIDLILDKIEIS